MLKEITSQPESTQDQEDSYSGMLELFSVLCNTLGHCYLSGWWTATESKTLFVPSLLLSWCVHSLAKPGKNCLVTNIVEFSCNQFVTVFAVDDVVARKEWNHSLVAGEARRHLGLGVL